MKRCPQCNRVETDETLKFCRTDGATLVIESASPDGEQGSARIRTSSADIDEIETSILPHTTDAAMSRGTGPTTVLPAQPPAGTTGKLAAPLSKRRLLTALAILVLVTFIIGGYFLFFRKPATAIDSIAVLPFQNVGGDPNVEYLSDGIAESLINSLTQLQQLKVIARSTAFSYRGREVNPQQIGRELGVRAVLTGRVRQAANKLSIQVDLVDAATGAQIWGEEYERASSDILSIKQAITREITEKLRLRISGAQQQQLAKRDTTSPEAYQFYLRGRYYWNKRTADGLKKAIEQFQQAIERDPNYALGYVGLADCYALLEEYTGVPSSETLPKARAAADRALQIDDTLAEAHTSSAGIYGYQWQWAESEQEYRRAISLNPDYATAHHWLGAHFYVMRRFDDALTEIKRAQELDPLSPVISVNVAEVYLFKNDIDTAIKELQKVLELEPGFPGARNVLGFACLKQRRFENALAEFQKAVELSGRSSPYLSSLGYCYGFMGKHAEALRILKELEERYTRREAIGQHLAGVYVGLGDKDQAFAWLEKDFQQRSGALSWINFWPPFDDLRADPRFVDLVRRMGLEP